MILANTIVGPLLGQWAAFHFLFTIIVIEGAIFNAFHSTMGPWKALGLVSLANAISTIGGFWIATQIPWPMDIEDSRLAYAAPPLPRAVVEAVVIGGQFLIAGLMSWWIECFVIRICCLFRPLPQLRRTVASGNAVTYGLLLVAYCASPAVRRFLAWDLFD